MANVFTKIRQGIGNTIHGTHQQSVPAQASPAHSHPAQPSATPAQAAFHAQQAAITNPLSMTPEQILETVAFDVPAHRHIANNVKNAWRIIGPVAFVAFTAWEVFYFMNTFMKAAHDDSLTSKVLLWGITLLIEIPFMIATYDQSERKQARAEKKALGKPYQENDTVGSVVMWFFLALVNVAGQVAFLIFITNLGKNPFQPDPAVFGMWFFIIVRVLGVLLGDAYTAFFLRPDETTIERVLRVQSAQATGRMAIQENRAELAELQAESDAKIRRIAIRVRKEEREATFMEEWNEMNMRTTLDRQKRYMIEEQKSLQLEPPTQKEATTDQLNGL